MSGTSQSDAESIQYVPGRRAQWEAQGAAVGGVVQARDRGRPSRSPDDCIAAPEDTGDNTETAPRPAPRRSPRQSAS